MSKRLKFRTTRMLAGYKTQKDLAKALGITVCAVSNIESGAMKTVPLVSTLRKLSTALKMPLEKVIKLFK